MFEHEVQSGVDFFARVMDLRFWENESVSSLISQLDCVRRFCSEIVCVVVRSAGGQVHRCVSRASLESSSVDGLDGGSSVLEKIFMLVLVINISKRTSKGK